MTLRLLNIETGKLEGPFQYDQAPKYAIASHCWGDDENQFTYRDLTNKGLDPQPGQTIPGPQQKVLSYCKFLLSYRDLFGVKYLWIDTCCIDKTSSAEESESVQLMGRYYKHADVCLTYLPDVRPTTCLSFWDDFRTDRWFRRGWTLPELVVPRNVVFINGNWQIFGYKTFKLEEIPEKMPGKCLNQLVSEIADIQMDVINGQTLTTSLNVDTVMRWMKNRNTTRKEDKAYCLIYLLGISMCIQYGQEELAMDSLMEAVARKNAKAQRESNGPQPTGDQSKSQQEIRSCEPQETVPYHEHNTKHTHATGEGRGSPLVPGSSRRNSAKSRTIIISEDRSPSPIPGSSCHNQFESEEITIKRVRSTSAIPDNLDCDRSESPPPTPPASNLMGRQWSEQSRPSSSKEHRRNASYDHSQVQSSTSTHHNAISPASNRTLVVKPLLLPQPPFYPKARHDSVSPEKPPIVKPIPRCVRWSVCSVMMSACPNCNYKGCHCDHDCQKYPYPPPLKSSYEHDRVGSYEHEKYGSWCQRCNAPEWNCGWCGRPRCGCSHICSKSLLSSSSVYSQAKHDSVSPEPYGKGRSGKDMRHELPIARNKDLTPCLECGSKQYICLDCNGPWCRCQHNCCHEWEKQLRILNLKRKTTEDYNEDDAKKFKEFWNLIQGGPRRGYPVLH